MRNFFLFIAILISTCATAQTTQNRPFWGLLRSASGGVNPCPGCTTPLSFTDIPTSTDFSRPGGNQNWNHNSGCQIVPNVPAPLSLYRRFFWSDLEGNTQGSWQFNVRLRSSMEQALAAGQLYSFGVGVLYPGPDLGGFSEIFDYNGFFSVYPQYVHNGMQAESLPDFNDGESWIPNYNSPTFLSRGAALWTNLKNWYDTAIIRIFDNQGNLIRSAPAMNMLQFIDIRMYGSYGEWHHCCLGNGYDIIANWPSGRFGTATNIINIINFQINAFPDIPFVALANTADAGFDNGNGFQNTKIPAQVGIYVLTARNNFGLIGRRRDQVGNDEDYYKAIQENNNMTFGGSGPAKDSIMTRYRYNYYVGEPQGGPANSCPNINMGCAPSQARKYHYYSFGNGNYGGCAGVPTGNGADSVRTAFRIQGARIKLNGGSMSTTLQQNAQFNVTLQFQNIGLATEFRPWTTQYELRNGANQAVWVGTIPFSIKGYYPDMGVATANNNFTLPNSVPVGTYRLVIRIIDPTGYMSPYPLGTNGRESDGAYQMRANISVIAGT